MTVAELRGVLDDFDDAQTVLLAIEGDRGETLYWDEVRAAQTQDRNGGDALALWGVDNAY